MDRHVARAQETLKIAKAMMEWLSEVAVGEKVFDDAFRLADGQGIGLTEAPRGALGHWVGISQGKITHYQIVTPTCWNASPMDDIQLYGPMEQALIGTPVIDPQQPIEVLRVIHSFDPCLSCAVHVIRPQGETAVLPISAAG